MFVEARLWYFPREEDVPVSLFGVRRFVFEKPKETP
jgi:hypothetical protein